MAFLFLVFTTFTASAIPVGEYRKQIQQVVSALDTLAQSDETENAADYTNRRAATVEAVRDAIPKTEGVEWNGATFAVDNSWLNKELDEYEKAQEQDRAELLRRMTERLQAIEERLAEIEQQAGEKSGNKVDESKKLAEILRRPEYARKVAQEGALIRLLKQFFKWLENLIPKPKPLAPGSASLFSKVAQWFVIILAAAVLGYVLSLFAPRLLRDRKTRKKTKAQARIVLGEKLEPDQSAGDLLAEAEALALEGELRAAIRKAYIALLVELGERKIISLAQHKTNRDYLGAVRRVAPLYENMKQLTDSFERHWYGFATVSDTDWRDFRSAYMQALR
jgi:hypothetical protein